MKKEERFVANGRFPARKMECGEVFLLGPTTGRVEEVDRADFLVRVEPGQFDPPRQEGGAVIARFVHKDPTKGVSKVLIPPNRMVATIARLNLS